jgi:dethiobiotin synthetase/adenosylmethionine--8-amino-7-oxononanoate aminotransferase
MINQMAVAGSNDGQREGSGSWDVYRKLWQPPSDTTSTTLPSTNFPFSFFAPSALTKLSHSPRVESVIALGTVIAIALRDVSGSGYSSNAAVELQKVLLNSLDQDGVGVHSRVLGNVLYLMTSLTTERGVVEGLEGRLIRALC